VENGRKQEQGDKPGDKQEKILTKTKFIEVRDGQLL
jgi:hypothetical protein